MNKIITALLFLTISCFAFAQPDTLKIKQYENLAIENLSKNQKEAKLYADSLQTTAESLNQKDKVALAISIKAQILFETGDPSQALQLYKHAEEIAKSINNCHLLYEIYNDMGVIFRNNEDSKTAFDYFNLAAQNAKKLNNDEILSDVYVNIGNTFAMNEEFEIGLKYYDSALNKTCELDKKNSIYGNIGYIYLNQEEYAKARDIYDVVLKNTNMENNAYQYAIVLNNLIIIDVEQGKYKDAEKKISFLDSLCLRNSLNYTRLCLYTTCYEYYEEIKNYKKAFEYLSKFFNLQDSIYNSEFDDKIASLKNDFQLEKTEYQLKEREERIAKQRELNIVLFSAVISTIIFIIVLSILISHKIKTNKLLNKSNKELALREQEINENLSYARLIQLNCMDNKQYFNNNIFIFDKPRNKVGGDFYLLERRENSTIVTLADSTGHGISGGFLSVVGIERIKAAIKENLPVNVIVSSINKAFFELNEKAQDTKSESLALSIIEIKENCVELAGSKQKIWIFSNGNLSEFKTDSHIIGINNDCEFHSRTAPIKHGDVILLSSDGFPDQFGYNNQGKFKYERFRNLLTQCANSPSQANEILAQALNEWKGDCEQTDDILIIGICI